MSKKPYSEYDCPVCQQKDIQQGSFGKHLVRHTTAELLPYVKNIDAVVKSGAHPEIHVANAIFAICPNTMFGYQKGLLKPLMNEKRHAETCKNLYHGWPQEKVEQTNVITCLMTKGDDGLVADETAAAKPVLPPTIAEPLVPAQEPLVPAQEPLVPAQTNVIIGPCECHLEITHLKNQLQLQTQELEAFRAWRQLILTSAPQNGAVPTQAAANVAPQLALFTQPPKVVKPKQVRINEPKVKAQPSKKEKEKGMWCETCETCKQTAQFATDLRACAKCKKMCHFNDDLVGCYHYDCEMCESKICLTCVKIAGPKSNKMHPMCSPECYKKYMSTR
jgi:hypothetical protein